MSTAELAEEYIRTHKAVKECLKEGLINYSALARKISKELGIEKKSSRDAVMIATIRYAKKIKSGKSEEETIKNLLKNSSLEIKNKVSVYILEKSVNLDDLIDIEKKARKKEEVFFSIEGTKSITLMISQNFDDEVKKIFKGKTLSNSHKNAVMIIKSPESIENVSGVLAYVSGLFHDNDVNIIESLSCWTDTIFIVKEDDVAKVMKFMQF